MKHDEQKLPGDLPTELVTELRHLAAGETAGSRPFPGVERTIRRRRSAQYVRYGSVALAGAVAAAVVVVEVLAGGAFDRGTPVAPLPSFTSPVEPTTPALAGYAADPVGSLAGDQEWLDGFMKRVRSMTNRNPNTLIPADTEVRVVAAGDIDDRARFAIVLSPTVAVESGIAPDTLTDPGSAEWAREFWLGPAGGSPDSMKPVTPRTSEDRGLVPTGPLTFFGPPDAAPENKNAVVIVSAPRAQSAEITSSRSFEAGQPTSAWSSHTVTRIGPGVWAQAVTWKEYFISEVAVDRQTVWGGLTRAPGFDLTEVAAPGTDPAGLDWLDGSMDAQIRPTLEEEPLYAGTTRIGKQKQMAAVLLRSPNGVYLYSVIQRRWHDDGTVELWRGNGLLPAGPDPSGVMAAVEVPDGDVTRFLVVAPEAATRVRVGEVTADVEGRLAVVNVPAGEVEPDVPAQALDADGGVVAEVAPTRSAQVATLLSDSVPDSQGTSVRP